MPTITKRGDRWQAKIRRRGFPPQSETFRTKGLAEKWARDVEAAMDAGRFVSTSREAERTTLDEALGRYLREITSKKRSNRPEQLRIGALRQHELAKRTLSSIRGSDVASLRDELAATRKPATVRLYLAVLSHLFKIAAREWGFEGIANPVANVAKPSVSGNARTRRAQGDELDRIIEAAKAIDWWAPAAISLAVETAMRRGEIAALQWQHVDLNSGVAHLPITKNSEPRDVPLSPRAIEILQSLPRQISGSVLGVSADTITKAFVRARKAAGVSDLRLHDLRREATSRLFERGDLSIVEVASITGHKTLQMLKRYSAPRATEIAGKLAKKSPHGAG